MRLIDAVALKKAFKRSPFVNEVHLYYARQLIDNAPTVEAYTYEQVKELVNLNKKLSEEIPHGEWYYSCQNGWHCSICQQMVKDMPTVMGKANFDYCPNCGADMRKEGKENDK